MGGFSWLVRRPAAAGDPTHALFAAQSHSIVDNLVALFEHSLAWHCSNQQCALADINGSTVSALRAMSAIAGNPEYIAVAQPESGRVKAKASARLFRVVFATAEHGIARPPPPTCE